MNWVVQGIHFFRHVKRVYVSFLMISVTILLYVYYLEYYEKIPVCSLCYRDRLVFFVMIVISGFAYKRILTDKIALKLLQGCCGMALALALYHLGVELQWWSSKMCAFEETVFSMENFQKALHAGNPEDISCSKIVWSFLGLSLVVYDILILVFLFFVALWAEKGLKKEAKING